MQQLSLLHNYNGKLFNDHFAIVEYHDSEQFFEGNEFELMLKSIPLGIVTVLAVNTRRLKDLPNGFAHLSYGKYAVFLAGLLLAQNPKATDESMIDLVVLGYTKRYYEAHTDLLREWWNEHLKMSVTQQE